MDLKEKMQLQLASLEKIYKELSPLVDKAQDEEFETKGWKDGFLQFIALLEQMNFKAGYKKGIREGLEHNQKLVLSEIEAIKRQYMQLEYNATKPIEQRSDVHPNIRSEAMRNRIAADKEEAVKSRKAKLKDKDGQYGSSE